MKKIVQINVVCNGSTGKIMCDIAQKCKNKGYEIYCFFGRGKPNKKLNCIKIGNKISTYIHVLLARVGFNGHGSYFATKKLIKQIRKINPDIIHLHNVHGYYINIKLLFNYLKNEYNGKIIWMLHDCWAFTGHCANFTLVKCEKWQKQCFNCPQLCSYPKTTFDTTKREYAMKLKLFLNLKNLTIVVPSVWLKKKVEKSFLNKYKTEIIHNGINLDIFKPTVNKEIFSKYNIPQNKNIILGVANTWDERKGLNLFFELSEIISNDEKIVLVGLNDAQKKKLPKNIIAINRTDDSKELAAIYSIASVFMNPSFEETFSLVTVEAMACGIPVIVCGMSAMKDLVNEKVGIVLNKYSANDYYNAYKNLKQKQLKKIDIINHASNYSNLKMIKKNIELYKE